MQIVQNNGSNSDPTMELHDDQVRREEKLFYASLKLFHNTYLFFSRLLEILDSFCSLGR